MEFRNQINNQNLELDSWPSWEYGYYSIYTQISSPLYTAPELKTQLGYNESVDVWGIGTILFTLLFGTFTSYSLNKMKSVLDRSSHIKDIINEDTKISDEWKLFLLSMLEDEFSKRPTASESINLEWIKESYFMIYTK